MSSCSCVSCCHCCCCCEAASGANVDNLQLVNYYPLRPAKGLSNDEMQCTCGREMQCTYGRASHEPLHHHISESSEVFQTASTEHLRCFPDNHQLVPRLVNRRTRAQPGFTEMRKQIFWIDNDQVECMTGFGPIGVLYCVYLPIQKIFRGLSRSLMRQ